MSEILKHGGNSPVTRMQSGIQLKNALYSKDSNIKAEYQQRWLTFPDDVRNVVKANVSIRVYTGLCLLPICCNKLIFVCFNFEI